MGKNNLTGAWGEALAAEYLRRKHYRIEAARYYSRFGEIDLIARNGRFLVFVEVKLRKSSRFALAREYVNRAKQDRIRMTASIYLSQQGYKVANIPLDPSTEPPSEVYTVDRTRLFGLMTSPEVLIGIRKRRIGNAGHLAPRYADPEYVYEDLEKSRALMRKLGCIVVHTQNRAVEETAQEILRYFERSHPPFSDDVS